MAERAEERGLPVQVFRKTIEHVTQGLRPAAQAQEFMHEDVRAGGVQLLISLISGHFVGQAKLAEGQRRTFAQEQTRLAHRIGARSAPGHRGLRLQRQGRERIDLDFLHQPEGQPRRQLGFAGQGVAIGDFEKDDPHDREEKAGLVHHLRHVHAITPAVGVMHGGDEDARVVFAHWSRGDVDR